MRLAQYFEHAYDPKTLTVRQIMEGAVFTVSPDTTGIAIAELMTERNFGAVPVVEHDSTLVGIVSEFDLLRAINEVRIRTPVVKVKTLVGIATGRDAVFAYVKATARHWLPRTGGGLGMGSIGTIRKLVTGFSWFQAEWLVHAIY